MHIFLLGLVVLALSSCAPTSDVMRVDNVSRRPTDTRNIQVFLDEPAKAYSTIAMVKISNRGWVRSLEELKAVMVTEVAKLGGDAVIVGTETTKAGTVFVPVGNMFYGVDSNQKVLVGKVIVFKNNP